MPTIPNVPFSAIPVEAGYDPDTEVFPLNRATTVLDLVGPDGNDREHLTGNKRDLTLQGSVNLIMGALNALFQGGPSNTALVLWRDGSTSFLGPDPLDMGTYKIINLADPVSAQDATTKNYVNAQDLLLLPLSGTRPMTGNLDLGNHVAVNSNSPTNGGDLTNKTYVNTQDLLLLPLDGTRTMTGAINMGTHRINNVTDPSSAQDAATKNYTNTQDLLLLPLTGARAMTGNLDFGTHRGVNLSAPTTGTDATTKTYVDTQDNLLLALSGARAMTGDLDLGSHKLVNVTDPTNPQDGTTKSYVNAQDLILLPLSGLRAMTGALSMGSHKIDDLSPGTLGTDAVNLNQLNAFNAGRLINLFLNRTAYSAALAIPGTSITPGTAKVCRATIPLDNSWGTWDLTFRFDIGSSNDPAGYRSADVYMALFFDGTNYQLWSAGVSTINASQSSGGGASSTTGVTGLIATSLPPVGGAATALIVVARNDASAGVVQVSLYRPDSATLVMQFVHTNDTGVTPDGEIMGIYKIAIYLRNL